MKMSAMTQVLTHRNPTHANDSFLRLSKLRREGILCDLTILVQGQKFKAHKVVMAACSDYFLTAICGGKSTASVSVSNGASGSHMTVELQNVTMRGFAPLLEYAYTSDLNVNASDVIDVLSAASYMQMFCVANACSEFMRSNLLWSQSQARLPGLPLLPGRRPLILNGQHGAEHGSSSPVRGRTNGLPEAVSNLFQATSAMSGNSAVGTGTPTLGRPPMLIPISSMNPYDVNLQQWADTMAAGTHNLISRIVNGQSNNTMSPSSSAISPASPPQCSPPSMSWKNDNPRPSSLQPPSVADRPSSTEMARSEGASPARKVSDVSFGEPQESEKLTPKTEECNNNNNSNNNNSVKIDKSSSGRSCRKSVAVKLESASDEELHANNPDNEEGKRRSPPGDYEDSWQSIQREYSFHKSEKDTASPDRTKSKDENNRNGLLRGPINSALFNSMAVSSNDLKTVLDKYKEAMPKLDNGLQMIPGFNGISVHRALLQQQLLAQQQQQHQQEQQQRSCDADKMVPELPAVPPGGQYMSVRRRTLQSSVPKPHQCQICGSRFTRFHNLKQHIKLHSGIKPYECDECGKRFTRNYTLRLHKMKHVGLRNFRCGTCDAAFTSLGEFRAHLRITMHSHLPVNGSGGSPQIQNRMLEPQDLSNANLPSNPLKFGQFDCSMFNYGVSSPGSSGGGAAGEGSTGTISPPGMANASHMLEGMDSPHMSDRSLTGSPQDLSTKRPLSDTKDKNIDVKDDEYMSDSPIAADRDLQSPGAEIKRRKLDMDANSPNDNSEVEKINQICDQNDKPMSLVVDTSAAAATECSN